MEQWEMAPALRDNALVRDSQMDVILWRSPRLPGEIESEGFQGGDLAKTFD